MFNTNADFTKERRRSGFEEYFEILLCLGSDYAPFLANFLKDDVAKGADDGFDELGEQHDSIDASAKQLPKTAAYEADEEVRGSHLLSVDRPSSPRSSANSPNRRRSFSKDGCDRSIARAHHPGGSPSSIFPSLLWSGPIRGCSLSLAVFDQPTGTRTTFHSHVEGPRRSSGAVWLAMFTSPFVLTVAFAFAAPVCAGTLDSAQR